VKIIDFRWPWRSVRAFVAKRCDIGLRLLLITKRKSHTPLQMRWKSSTLGDLKNHYCNRNCVGCSASSLATAGLSCSYLITTVRAFRVLSPLPILYTYCFVSRILNVGDAVKCGHLFCFYVSRSSLTESAKRYDCVTFSVARYEVFNAVVDDLM